MSRQITMEPQREEEVSLDVTVKNAHGLHARPVMQMVDVANRFESSICVIKDDRRVDGKSPMEIMLLEAVCGTRLRLTARGRDAQQAVDALADLIQKGFDYSA